MIKPKAYKTEIIDKNTAKVSFKLDDDLFYLKGHFEVQPLLPGVVQVGYVVDFAKELLNLDVITNFQVIKFLSPIIPEDTVELTLKYNETKQSLDFEYYLKNQEKVASKGKAKVSCNSNLA
ncbi:MAG: hypothetical protein SPK02_00280 [Succinivibrio sp.]|nr:hydroxymyristoyl-ACP dehydratase [Succinivibrio sp.]MDY5733140.1 hypothetical protein [Succinivibrio sp.]MDY5904973.1 hypothetical protein [Succinivibrio sp.]